MLTFIFICGLTVIIYTVVFKDSRCERCGKKYERGTDEKGMPIWANKHLSKNFIPNMSLGGGSDGGDQRCYCTDCYVELFHELPEDTGR